MEHINAQRNKHILKVIFFICMIGLSFLCGALVQAYGESGEAQSDTVEQVQEEAPGEASDTDKNGHATPHGHSKAVIVAAGDTLWSIAREYGPKDADIRESVYHLKRINKLKGSTITIGQTLVLPF
ncbi:LysM peptidoglycan-binding domain-containing protein [Paenibacillus sp. y28]|uniref:LysM peptidoglycan-binding domain-containing protein n=1 Tax=Paenibacillus sp. y28 TaxID=3129110 RepID=UPI003018EF65